MEIRSFSSPLGHNIQARSGGEISAWTHVATITPDLDPRDPRVIDPTLKVLNDKLPSGSAPIAADDCIFDGKWRPHG